MIWEMFHKQKIYIISVWANVVSHWQKKSVNGPCFVMCILYKFVCMFPFVHQCSLSFLKLLAGGKPLFGEI